MIFLDPPFPEDFQPSYDCSGNWLIRFSNGNAAAGGLLQHELGIIGNAQTEAHCVIDFLSLVSPTTTFENTSFVTFSLLTVRTTTVLV